ncbi:transcriptional regulator with PAS, ATPase and Fis domain [Melghirimyces profundicolus]|uniref:Transcriptional regulator with PAS, ATPase and Fis domain n=1 Tax=Melghirimyces profundicolus TaxID=1242148 RepID=A0A2T6C8B7_9BACL|nr:sigma-54-dependent Fis family transcriptional regulator [Melghirimyces profundicolus]PTX64558.1 transcriptional regulator with PAS, ATPase and Fis domain [Melghirimyces profundicolus]
MKVLGIAPYPGLKKLMLELGDQEPSIDLFVEVGDLEEGLERARQASKEGYDLIISRGGTARLIRESVSLPVIDIPISGYDMLRVLTLIRDYRGEAAIVGFPNIVEGAITIRDLLGLNIQSHTLQHSGEVQDLLFRLQEKGVQVVIGDVITVRAAEETGLNGILITSGKEAVLEAFRQAKQTYRVVRDHTRRSRLFRTVLEEDDRGILVADGEGEAQYANPRIRKWLGLETDSPEVVASTLFRREPRLRGAEGQQLVRLPGGPLLAVDIRVKDSIKIWVLRETTLSSDAGMDIRYRKLARFARITGHSRKIREAVKKGRKISRTVSPVWILGEAGTGKETFAQAIHSESGISGPFITLDFNRIDPKEAPSLLFGEKDRAGVLEAGKEGSVYFRNADRFPADLQKRLFRKWKSGKDLPRLMFSSTLPPGKEEGVFYFDPATSILSLPPLKERMEDLEDLCRLFLAELNTKYGKQIVGLEPALLREFREISWPGNIAQLQSVLESLVRRLEGPYLPLREGKEEWERSRSQVRNVAEDNGWLDGTLEEIEQRIIRQVLKEEGNNQTRAAKRLGINRTTLWRKLNR